MLVTNKWIVDNFANEKMQSEFWFVLVKMRPGVGADGPVSLAEFAVACMNHSSLLFETLGMWADRTKAEAVEVIEALDWKEGED